jgi:DNA-binding response OmpR family regulator
MRLLLIEDDEKIGGFIAQGLRQEGHVVDWSRNGEEGLGLALDAKLDAAIIDLMLPGRDGLSVIRELRERRQKVPVIILSAKSDVEDRVKGLSVGADDYLTKPFSFAELLARLHALVRRSSGSGEVARQLSFEDLTLDLESRRVTRAGQSIELQAREVRAAGLSAAKPRPGSVQDHDPRARLELLVRSADQRGRRVGQPAAPQD